MTTGLKESAAGASILHLAVKSSALLGALVLVRLLPVDDYGRLLSLQALFLAVGAIWDAGLATRLTRDLAAAHSSATELGAALRAKTMLVWIPFVGIVVAVVTIGAEAAAFIIAAVALFLACFVYGITALLIGLMQGTERYREAGWAIAAGRLVTVLLLPAAVAVHGRMRVIVCAAAYLVGELASLRMARRSVAGLRYSIWSDARAARAFLRRSAPLALNGVFILLYNKLDVVIVLFAAGPTIAGLYGPASRVQDLFGLLPAVLVTAAIPIMARNSDRLLAVRDTVWRTTRLGLLTSVPAAAATALLAPVAIPAVLGGEYRQTGLAVSVLAVSFPFIAFESPRIAALVSLDHTRDTAVVFGAAFALSFGAQFTLAHIYGLTGAAVGALAREPVLAFGTSYALSRRTRGAIPMARHYRTERKTKDEIRRLEAAVAETLAVHVRRPQTVASEP